MLKVILLSLIFSSTLWAQSIRDFKDLGEQIEGCPNGCDCITDANRENRAKRKLGEFEGEGDQTQEGAREVKTRTK